VQGALVSEDQMLDAVPDAAAAAPAGVLGPAAAAGAVAEVLRLLAASSRPVLLAGHGVRVAGAQQDLLKLVALLKVPVLGTFNGTDLIPSAHLNFAGRIGTIGGRAGNFVLQNADLLLSLGSRNNIRQVSYGWKTYARGAKKVVVDIDPAELGKHTVVPDLPVCMDAGAFIRALSAAASAVALPDWSPWLAWAQERKRRYPVAPAPAASGPVNPYRFVARLSAALGEGAVVVTANATPSIAGFQSADIKPGQRWLWNSGCASMGWDLPAAVGASCALGRGQVVCLSGDGSSMLNIQELATIAQNRLPIKIFLFNNGGYSSIRQTQAAYFERRWVGIDAASGVGFPDFVKLAGAFGLKAERLTDEADADAVIRSVLAEAGPVLCEVVLPTDYAFEPKLSSARLPDGRMVSKPLEDLSPLLDRDEFRSNMIIPVLEE
jgi:acetolactate synthase-1/2/3 large subunit